MFSGKQVFCGEVKVRLTKDVLFDGLPDVAMEGCQVFHISDR